MKESRESRILETFDHYNEYLTDILSNMEGVTLDKKRQEYNLAITRVLQHVSLLYVELRFGQILWMLEIVRRRPDMVMMDPLYEEPWPIWERIGDKIYKLNDKIRKIEDE